MILVAGAGGHVGREIVRKAVGQGIQIRCFDKAVFDPAGMDASGLEIVSGDMSSLEALLLKMLKRLYRKWIR